MYEYIIFKEININFFNLNHVLIIKRTRNKILVRQLWPKYRVAAYTFITIQSMIEEGQGSWTELGPPSSTSLPFFEKCFFLLPQKEKRYT